MPAPEKKLQFSRLIPVLLSLLGTLSTEIVFMSSMRVMIIFNERLVTTISVIAWLVGLIMFGAKKKTKLRSVVSGVLAVSVPLAMIIRFSDLTQGISDIVAAFGAYISDGTIRDIRAASSEENFAVAIVVILIAFICVYAQTSRSGMLLPLIVTVPPVELCLFFGLVPLWTSFMGIMVFWASCAVSERSAKICSGNERSARVRNQTVALSVFAVITAASVGFIAAAGHERSDDVKDLRSLYLTYVSEMSLESFTSDLKNALFPGKEHKLTHDGNLGNIDEIVFDGDTILEVTIPADSELLYLKGFTGDRYNGSGWSESDYEPELTTKITSAEFFPMRVLKEYSRFRDLDTKYIVVRNTESASKPRYFPSFAAGLLESDGIRRKYWGYFPGGDWQTEVINSAPYENLTDEMHEDELLLRQHAYKDCLYVPPSFDCADEFFSEYSGRCLTDELMYIRQKLSADCEYTLESGRRPVGKDFAKWFLNENKKGSCTHFATAAVLLCRSRGIPARYCEGFIIDTADAGADSTIEGDYITMSVPDNRAHAWAEIYIDGFGWMVFESTPGYGNIMRSFDDDMSYDSDSSEITAVETAAPVFDEEIESSTAAETTVSEEETAMTTLTVSESAVSDGSTEQSGREREVTQTGRTSADSNSRDRSEDESETKENGGNMTLPQDTQNTDGGNEDNTQPVSETQTAASSENTDGNVINKAVLNAIFRIIVFICVIALCGFIIIKVRIIIIRNHCRLIKEDPSAAVRTIYRRFSVFARRNGVDISVPDDRTYTKFDGIADTSAVRMIIAAALESRFGTGITPEKAQKAIDSYNSIMAVYCRSKGAVPFITRVVRWISLDYRYK